MKKLLVLISLLGALSAQAQVVNANWIYHPVQCLAETTCPNGRVIRCATVGFNYGNAPRHINNMCRSRVIPGQFIHCQGFADQTDQFGRLVFVPANYPVSCF